MFRLGYEKGKRIEINRSAFADDNFVEAEIQVTPSRTAEMVGIQTSIEKTKFVSC